MNATEMGNIMTAAKEDSVKWITPLLKDIRVFLELNGYKHEAMELKHVELSLGHSLNGQAKSSH